MKRSGSVILHVRPSTSTSEEEPSSRKCQSGGVSHGGSGDLSHKRKITLMQREGILTDVHLQVQDQVFYAHKLILSTVSCYLKELFSGLDSGPCTIEMGQVAPLDVYNVLKYIYDGEAQLKSSDQDGFLKAAQILQIDTLISKSQTFERSNENGKQSECKSGSSAGGGFPKGQKKGFEMGGPEPKKHIAPASGPVHNLGFKSPLTPHGQKQTFSTRGTSNRPTQKITGNSNTPNQNPNSRRWQPVGKPLPNFPGTPSPIPSGVKDRDNRGEIRYGSNQDRVKGLRGTTARISSPCTGISPIWRNK